MVENGLTEEYTDQVIRRDTVQKQTVEFAVKRDNGIITRVGRTGILQPKPNYKGNSDSVKWYEDKPKQKSK